MANMGRRIVVFSPSGAQVGGKQASSKGTLPISLPTYLKEPQKKKDLASEKALFPPSLFPSTDPQYHKCEWVRTNPNPQKQEWYQFTHERTCWTKKVFVGIPNAIEEAKWVEQRTLVLDSMLLVNYFTPKWKSFRVNALFTHLGALRDIYKLDPPLNHNHTTGKMESTRL